MMRRLSAVAIAAVLAIALSGCTGLWMSGPVTAGMPPSGNAAHAPVAFLPEAPLPDGTPQQIVEGFIRAGSGTSDGWQTAKQFLVDRDTWQPTAGVTVYDPTDRTIVPVTDGDVNAAPDDEHATIQLTVKRVADVDKDGVYRPVVTGVDSTATETKLIFTLAKNHDGQWRIVKAPNGVVLDAKRFAILYRPYSLMFFDTDWTHLVPDVRWFPVTNSGSSIVQALKRGPSAWLLRSVRSAFPENVNVGQSVANIDGTAQVELKGPVVGMRQLTLDRIQTQLEHSLATAGFTDVTMSSASAEIGATALPVSEPRPGEAVVLGKKGFGYAQPDGTVRPVSGLDPIGRDVHPNAIQLSPDTASRTTAAAIRVTDGHVAAVADGRLVADLDKRGGLIPPTIGAGDFVWSVPRNQPGAVLAIGLDRKATPIGDAWARASSIQSMRISRDGTRAAAAVVVNGHPVIAVAGIVRDANGVPRQFGDAEIIGSLPGEAIDLAWLDDSTLGVLAHDGDGITLVTQQIGAIPVDTDGQPGAIAIAAGSSAGAVRLLDSKGTLYQLNGSNWQEIGSGVQVLAQ